MENRLMDLETRVAFQEENLAELNETAVRQQREIDALRAELETMRSKLRELTPSPVGDAASEPPPPHY
jgi:SlyX protein